MMETLRWTATPGNNEKRGGTTTKTTDGLAATDQRIRQDDGPKQQNRQKNDR